MNSSRNMLIAIAALAPLFLTACGGGGDSTSTTQPETTETVLSPLVADLATLQKTATAAATSTPKFGSVTQTSNSDPNGTTTDSASTEFGDGSVTLTITRSDGTTLKIGSADRQVSVNLQPLLTGYTFQGEGLVNESEDGNEILIAAVYVNWDEDDDTDYLAGGYWTRVDIDPADDKTFTSVDMGAFVDGPELGNGDRTYRTEGTATYKGQSAGLYTYDNTSNQFIGEYTSSAELTADFDDKTISGCLGCDGRVTIVAADKDGKFYNWNLPIQVFLDAATFDMTDDFTGDVSRVVRFDRSGLIEANGNWGGRFSNKFTDGEGDTPGDPRLAAGTVGADWTEASGARGTLLGAWFATLQE